MLRFAINKSGATVVNRHWSWVFAVLFNPRKWAVRRVLEGSQFGRTPLAKRYEVGPFVVVVCQYHRGLPRW